MSLVAFKHAYLSFRALVFSPACRSRNLKLSNMRPGFPHLAHVCTINILQRFLLSCFLIDLLLCFSSALSIYLACSSLLLFLPSHLTLSLVSPTATCLYFLFFSA
jgi:hypothetical protein